MKREIKFRAWDDKMKIWLLGYEYQNLGGFSMMGETMLFGEYSKMLNSYSFEYWDNLKIMQYAGLLDKNKKEIYEGDIVKRTDGLPLNGSLPNNKVHLPPIGIPVIVFYHDGQFKVSKKSNDAKRFQFNSLTIRMAGLEIIGNIYENPELLNTPSPTVEKD